MITWLKYIIYIDEYIPKLHIHQHSLLTRKVFFRHNFQHWSSSLYQLDHLIICILSLLSLQVIFIFKSSSLDLDHFSIWIIMEHHHWIWIISRSGSTSLDLIWIITWSVSSLLDLDHHWLSSLDLDHHWCYLMILLIIGSSTDPALFHAGCRPTLM